MTEDTRSLGEIAGRVGQPVVRNGRRVRALNPYARADVELIETLARGEFLINGLRNRDLRAVLYPDGPSSPAKERRRSAATSRKLALLRAHQLIRKVPRTHRYQLTREGRILVTALLTARQVSADSLTKLAA